MTDIGYDQWAFIPVDDDPLTGEPTSFNPPMITTMALDLHTSLIFRFAAATSPLRISVECTALSAEQPTDSFFDVLTGVKADHYTPLDPADWELHYDGMYAIFTTEVGRADPFVKLHYKQRQNLIIANVNFSQP